MDFGINSVAAYHKEVEIFRVRVASQPRALGWKSADLEAVAAFVTWLRLPPVARSGAVAVLPTVAHHCTASSVKRKPAAICTFYDARSGVEVADLLVTMRPAGRHHAAATSYKSFLAHIASGQPERTRTIKPNSGRKRPRALCAAGLQRILDGCGYACGPAPVRSVPRHRSPHRRGPGPAARRHERWPSVHQLVSVRWLPASLMPARCSDCSLRRTAHLNAPFGVIRAQQDQ